ncbi:MAG: hypothetical protein EOP06_05635 [Proteobacteria bacterium]|nr:MAG: hypothetical protein EOP06_05635 [Pseudomonadota bacterium]
MKRSFLAVLIVSAFNVPSAGAQSSLGDFVGKKLSELPVLTEVSSTPHLRIFVSPRFEKCQDKALGEKIFNADEASRAVKVALRSEKFISKFAADFSKLDPLAAKKLFPVNVVIDLASAPSDGRSGMRAKLEACPVNPVPVSEQNLRKNVSVLVLGSAVDPKQVKVSLEIMVHEFGHLVLRSLNYPEWFPYEELFADILKMGISGWNPYMAEGMTVPMGDKTITLKDWWDVLRRMLADKAVGNPRTVNLLEAQLRSSSDVALRDFTLSLPYEDYLILPEKHQAASYLAPAFFELGQEMGAKLIFGSFLKALVEKRNSFFNPDPVKAFEPFFKLHDHSVNEFGWKKSVATAGLSTRLVRTHQLEPDDMPRRQRGKGYELDDKRESSIFELLIDNGVKSRASKKSASPLNLSFNLGSKTILADLVDAGAKNLGYVVVAVKSCEPQNQSCTCVTPAKPQKLNVSGTFVNTDSQIETLVSDTVIDIPAGCWFLHSMSPPYSLDE